MGDLATPYYLTLMEATAMQRHHIVKACIRRSTPTTLSRPRPSHLQSLASSRRNSLRLPVQVM